MQTKKDDRVIVAMRLPRVLKDSLHKQARKEGRSATNLAIRMMIEGLEARKVSMRAYYAD